MSNIRQGPCPIWPRGQHSYRPSWYHRNLADHEGNLGRFGRSDSPGVFFQTNQGGRAFHACTPSLYHNIPWSLHPAPSIATFRKRLKTRLFDWGPVINSSMPDGWPVNVIDCFINFSLDTDWAVILLSLALRGYWLHWCDWTSEPLWISDSLQNLSENWPKYISCYRFWHKRKCKHVLVWIRILYASSFYVYSPDWPIWVIGWWDYHVSILKRGTVEVLEYM